MKGIFVYGGDDQGIGGRAKKAGLPVIHGEGVANALPLPFAMTLIVQAGMRVPWDLLPSAWHFLERWDVAVPMYRYNVRACDIGSAEARTRTREVVGDLRALLYAHELLFLRGEVGAAVLETWLGSQAANEEDVRLAFLRAVHLVKPRVCVLPTSWVISGGVGELGRRGEKAQGRKGERGGRGEMVLVEVGNGQFLRCKAGDEGKVREMWEANRGRRK